MTRSEIAIRIANDVNSRLTRGEVVYLSNHLRAVKLSKKHAGAVSADGAGIRIYGKNYMPIGTFSVSVEA